MEEAANLALESNVLIHEQLTAAIRSPTPLSADELRAIRRKVADVNKAITAAARAAQDERERQNIELLLIKHHAMRDALDREATFARVWDKIRLQCTNHAAAAHQTENINVDRAIGAVHAIDQCLVALNPSAVTSFFGAPSIVSRVDT